MGVYVLIAILLIVGIWLVVRISRTPRMPARRPFDPDDSGSLIGQKRKPPELRIPPGPSDGV
jgi:hypothetical protein